MGPIERIPAEAFPLMSKKEQSKASLEGLQFLHWLSDPE